MPTFPNPTPRVHPHGSWEGVVGGGNGVHTTDDTHSTGRDVTPNESFFCCNKDRLVEWHII